MFTLYLICLIVGGVLLLAAIFAGSDTDSDFSKDRDIGKSGGSIVSFFNIRNLVLFIAFFGLTGVVLAKINVLEPLTLLTAAIFGCLAAVTGHSALGYWYGKGTRDHKT